MPVAMLPARPVVEKALPAMFEAWLNLSHREKARELVMVRAIAIAVTKKKKAQVSSCHTCFFTPARELPRSTSACFYSPTRGSQMNMKRTKARMARATQSRGWT